MLKPKSIQNTGCTSKKFKEMLYAFQKADGFSFLRREKYWWWNSCSSGPQWRHECIVKHYKTCVEPAVQSKKRGIVKLWVMFLASLYRCWHSSTGDAFNWELFNHPPYSPDLAPSDFLKNWRFSSNMELMEGVKTWLMSQPADLFDTDVHKVIPLYKCLNSGVSNNNFLVGLFKCHRRWLFEYPLYIQDSETCLPDDNIAYNSGDQNMKYQQVIFVTYFGYQSSRLIGNSRIILLMSSCLCLCFVFSCIVQILRTTEY
jgi:hypothetical protein